MSDSPDLHLQLKKRARRRLVGAIAVAGLAAVVLPMVMDEEPKQQIQDVQIRIPGQNQTPFNPKVDKPHALPATTGKTVAASAAHDSATPQAPPSKPAESNPEKPDEKKTENKVDRAIEKTNEKTVEKAAEKSTEKPAEKSPLKPAEKSAKAGDAKASDNGQYLILIGAFSNPANVKLLQAKIGELGIKVITEPLDSPEGRKTRVRAGPFASREAADKALDKMKRIGVGGVVAAKQ
jgi:DedD protein